jgi:hypothetical protein
MSNTAAQEINIGVILCVMTGIINKRKQDLPRYRLYECSWKTSSGL